jgi:DNA-binding SARP family transcriptional activator
LVYRYDPHSFGVPESPLVNADLRVAVLGPVEITGDDGAVALSGTYLPALLCMLAMSPGRAVHNDRLVDALWPHAAPDRAQRSLISLVFQLNTALERSSARSPDRRTHPEPAVRTIKHVGRALHIDPDSVDVVRFERVVAAADASADQGRLTEAVAGYRSAVDLWRGTPFGGIDLACFVEPGARLQMLRARAETAFTELSLRTGSGAELVPLLQQRVEADAHDEGAAALLARALYQAGRASDALAALRRCIDALRHRGLAPAPATARLELAILDHTLDAAEPTLGAPVQAARRSALAPAGAGVTRSPPQLRAARVAHFVGRRQELEVLTDTWLSTIAERRPVLAAIRGRGGMGKTALAAQFAETVVANSVAAADVSIAFLRAGDSSNAPLHVLGPWLVRIANASATPTAIGWQAAQIMSGVAQLDDIDAATFVTQAAALMGSAVVNPTLLVLDDMQWCDELSRNILRTALVTATEAPVMVLSTERAGSRPRLTISDEVEVTLGPLAADDMQALVSLLHSPLDPVELRDRTDGVPLYVGLALDGGGDFARRLASLSERARRSLVVSAVLGTACEVAHAVAVAGDSELHVTEDIDDAERVGLARLTSDGHIEFVHDLGHEFVLGATSDREISGLAARALDRLPVGTIDRWTRLSLARRAGVAVDVGTLVDITCDAVRLALAGLSFEHALRDAETTLADPRLATEDGRVAARLVLLQARAALGLGDSERAHTLLGLVHDVIDKQADPVLEAELLAAELLFGIGTRPGPQTVARLDAVVASLGDQHDSLVYRLRRRLVAEQLNLGDPLEAQITIERMKAMIPADDDGRERADLMPLENWAADARNDFARCAAIEADAVAMQRLPMNAKAHVRLCQTIAYGAAQRGEAPVLERARGELADRAIMAGEPHAAWQAEATKFVLALWSADLDRARRAADDAFQFGARRGIVTAAEVWQVQTFLLSWVSGSLGGLRDFLRHLPAIQTSQWAGALALCEAVEGNRAVASTLLDEAVAALAQWRSHYLHAMITVIVGEAAFLLGRDDLAPMLWDELSPRRGRSAGYGGMVDFGPIDLTLARCAHIMDQPQQYAQLSASLTTTTVADVWRRRARLESSLLRGEPIDPDESRAWGWLTAIDLRSGRR